jgi:hypothetical protein
VVGSLTGECYQIIKESVLEWGFWCSGAELFVPTEAAQTVAPFEKGGERPASLTEARALQRGGFALPAVVVCRVDGERANPLCPPFFKGGNASGWIRFGLIGVGLVAVPAPGFDPTEAPSHCPL